MKNKLDNILDAIYGNKVQGRWIKVLITLLVIGFIVFMIFNFNYDPKTGIDINAVDPAKLKGAK